MIKLIEREPSLEFVIPVLKWLKDPESVSKEERESNSSKAFGYHRCIGINSPVRSYAPARASLMKDAAFAATNNLAEHAERRINEYFVEISLTRKEYHNEISITREEVESELFKGEATKKALLKGLKGSIAAMVGVATDENNDSFVDSFVELIQPVGDAVQPTNIYMHNIKGVDLDCYDVLLGFNVTCPATQHAIKKQLCGGSRGYKDRRKDLSEAIDSLKRAVKLIDDNHQQEEK